MLSPATSLTAAALVVAALAAPARAHPHVFIDGGVDFLFDEAGQLRAVRVTWIYDAFASLFVVEQLKLDQDGDGVLSAEDEAALVADQTQWPDEYEGDSYLAVAGAPAEIGRPEAASAALEDGRVVIRFERALETPVPAEGLRATAQLYDPSYFFAYFVEQPPTLDNAPEGCVAEVVAFDPDTELKALQQTLAELSAEETPEQENVGALFADRVELRCG